VSNKKVSILNVMMAVVLLALVIALTGMFGYRKYQKVQQENKRISGKINSEKQSIDDLRCFCEFVENARAICEEEKALKEWDLFTLQDESFANVHLSMWNTSMLSSEWYYSYFAENIYYSKYDILTPQDLKEYFDVLSEGEVRPHTIYINLDPYTLSENYYERVYYEMDAESYEEYVTESIFNFVEDNPDITFHLFLPTKSLTFWSECNESQYEAIWNNWYSFLMYLRWWPNVEVSYMGSEEWLICNDNTFVSENVQNDAVSLREYIYMYAFDKYRITPPELEQKKEIIRGLTDKKQAGEYNYTDISSKEIVFYGDSVFAYYSPESISIAEQVQGMTGKECYDFSVGGTTASKYLDNSFTDAINSHSDCHFDNPCFVVMYGFNDYFEGLSVSDFELGLTQGIDSIKTNYPNSKILVISPYFSTIGNGGTDKNGECGGTLDEYRIAAKQICNKCEIDYLNLDEKFDLNFENESEYLIDGVHPRLWFVLEISKAIAAKLSEE